MQPDAAALRAAYAECERLARAHYENFPVASVARAGAHAAARRGALRVRPDGGRLCRRGTAARRGAVAGCWMIGRIGCTRALRNALLTTVCLSRWVRPFAPVIFRCRSSTICSARFVRISRRIATTRGRACSITAAARRIRSAGSCSASPDTTTRGSIARRTRSARRCS